MRRLLCTLYAMTCLTVLSSIAPCGPVFGAQAATATAPSTTPRIDPQALDALNKMGNYLRSLKSFDIHSETTTEKVLDNDQKVLLGGTMNYRVRQPDSFVISSASDRKVREYYYDGKNFTIYAPRMSLYSTVSAPPTIKELFKRAYDKYGIEFPLEDLFRWGSSDNRFDDLTDAVLVGYAKINGQDSDQFAIREGNKDWQVWIQRGDKPLPLKLAIVDTSDETMPEYTAVLQWNTSATFADDIFTFKPPADAKPIALRPEKH